MHDRYKKLLYLTGFATMISSLWVLAQAQSLELEANRHYWPAKDPVFFQKVLNQAEPDAPVVTANLSPDE